MSSILEEYYEKRNTTHNTTEIYRELAYRSGYTQQELRNIMAILYDILAEKSVVNPNGKNTVTFDGALKITTRTTPQHTTDNDDGGITIHAQKTTVGVQLGPKIRGRIIDLINEQHDNQI